MTHASKTVVALWLMALSASCAPRAAGTADGGITDDSGLVAIPFELGTGLTEWQPIPLADAHMKLIMGPQGGYHVLGRLKYSTFSSDIAMRFRLSSMDGTVVYNNPNDILRRRDRQGLFNNGTGWESTSAELVIFTAIRAPAEVAGQTVRWQVVIEDNLTGQRAYAERTFVVDWP